MYHCIPHTTDTVKKIENGAAVKGKGIETSGPNYFISAEKLFTVSPGAFLASSDYSMKGVSFL
jgi:hypothetical protein